MMFSVIVPMYNVEKYATQCIESILNQACKDFELILVNDGSSDNTLGIIESYAAKDERIRVVSKENGGLTSARKAGAAVASGDYVAVVDGDDWIEPEYLQLFEHAVKQRQPDMILCGYSRVWPDKRADVSVCSKPIREGFYSRKEIEEHILPDLFSVIPTIWAKAIRRELYLEAQRKIDNSISMGEDGCMVYPLIANASSLYVLNKAPYCYRTNPDSLTNSKKKRIPWENIHWRLAHYEKNLPMGIYHMDEQLASFAVHACFNAAVCEFRNRPYREASAIVLTNLGQPDIMKYLRKPLRYGSKSERIAGLALCGKHIWLIKLYCVLRG